MASSKHNTMEEEEGMRCGDSEEGTTPEEKGREEKRQKWKYKEEER